MSVGLALEALGQPDRRSGQPARGPLGGNLENPDQYPERRRAPFTAPMLENGAPGLHRPDSAYRGILNEQPWHRMVAHMVLNRIPNKKIAEYAEVTESYISILRGQYWFQELLAVLANEQGEGLTALISSQAVSAFQRIVTLAETSESERIALAANQLILEHAHGKPVQRVVSNISHSVSRSPADEMAEIQQELDAIRRPKALQ